MVKGAKAAATARLVEAFMMFKLEGIKVEKEKDCELFGPETSRDEIDLAIKRLSNNEEGLPSKKGILKCKKNEAQETIEKEMEIWGWDVC
jgi:hypothetical protein